MKKKHPCQQASTSVNSSGSLFTLAAKSALMLFCKNCAVHLTNDDNNNDNS